MEIFFCEACGRRVSDLEIERGEARKAGDQVWCANCFEKASPPLGQAAAARSGERNRLGEPRPVTPRPARRPASATRVRPARPASRPPSRPPARAKSPVPLYAGLFGIGIGLGVGFLVLVRGMGGGGGAPPPDTPRAPRPPRPRVERSAPPPETAAAAADRTARTAGKRPPRPEAPRAASPRKTASAAGAGKFALDFAKINLDAALRYARENPDDVRGQVYKFETVSRNYPGTPSAERAAEEAGKLRAGRPELFADEVTVKPYKIPELDRKRYDCPRRTAPVTIDGRLGEWNELPQECRRPAQIELTASSWTGPADCSFRFALEYDDEYVYVAVDTTDDRFVTAPDTLPWQQDGIEIRIDARPDPKRSYGRGENEFADIFLIALGPGETPGDMYFFQKEKWPEGVRAVCLKTGTGFATEAAIPVSYLDEKQGRQWQAFRLNIAVDDHDGAPGDPAEGAQIWWCPDWRRDKNRPGSGTFKRRASWPVEHKVRPMPEVPKRGPRARKGPPPVFKVSRRTASITVEGALAPDEWPGRPMLIAQGIEGEEAGPRSRAWLAFDDEHLFVAVDNTVDPSKPLRRGRTWGADDAVEVALRNPAAGKEAPIFVLRGYTNGHFESSTEAGAPADAARRAAEGVMYAAKVLGKDRWTAEWRIPFAGLAVDPKKHARLEFNLTVRKTAAPVWLMWQGTGGYSWLVQNAGVTEFAR